MNVYQQEMIDAAIEGLTEYHPQLKLKAVMNRVGNAITVPESCNKQLDYEATRDLVERNLREHEDADIALLIIDSYPGGNCPDCYRKISMNVFEGSECTNCGHVFTSSVS